MKVKVISLPCIFQVLYVLCFTKPRYQVSVYRTIGPLVLVFFYKLQNNIAFYLNFLLTNYQCNCSKLYSRNRNSHLLVGFIRARKHENLSCGWVMGHYPEYEWHPWNVCTSYCPRDKRQVDTPDRIFFKPLQTQKAQLRLPR